MKVKELIDIVSPEEIVPYVSHLVASNIFNNEIHRAQDYIHVFLKILNTLKSIPIKKTSEPWEIEIQHGLILDSGSKWKLVEDYKLTGRPSGCANGYKWTQFIVWNELLDMEICDWCLQSQEDADVVTTLIFRLTTLGHSQLTFEEWHKTIGEDFNGFGNDSTYTILINE